jgi:hypothetical protein
MYALTERKDGSFHVEWGTLPRNHGKYAVLDELQAWPPEEMSKLRGVLNDGEIQFHKVRRGRRPCALRYVATANPAKAMKDYAYPIAAIPEVRPLKYGADMSRFDYYIAFREGGVAPGAIARRQAGTRPWDDRTWRDFVAWGWSRDWRTVTYKETAKIAIMDATERIMRDYTCARIPIVHPGYRDVLTRTAVAYAVLRFSTTNGADVDVGPEHVDMAAGFLERMFAALQLAEYRTHVEGGVSLGTTDYHEIVYRIGPDGLRILELIVTAPEGHITAQELAKRLGGDWTANQVRDMYGTLEGLKLIEAKAGVGAVAAPKGVATYRAHGAVMDLFSTNPVKSPEVFPDSRQKKLPETPGGGRTQ